MPAGKFPKLSDYDSIGKLLLTSLTVPGSFQCQPLLGHARMFSREERSPLLIYVLDFQNEVKLMLVTLFGQWIMHIRDTVPVLSLGS